MWRVLFALILGTSGLHASSFSSTTCTAGTTTISPCGGSLNFPGGLFGPGYTVVGFAAASDNSILPGLGLASPPLPSIAGQAMSAVAEAAESGSGPPFILLSATAQAQASSTFYTAGPARSGLIQFVVELERAHGGGSDALLTDGVHRYSYDVFGFGSTPPSFCDIYACGWTAVAPFELGSTFQVSASASADESGLPYPEGPSSLHGNVDSMVVFKLLESDGKTPVPFSLTPEPSSWCLLFLGLAASSWFLLKRGSAAIPRVAPSSDLSS